MSHWAFNLDSNLSCLLDSDRLQLFEHIDHVFRVPLLIVR